MNNLSMMAPVLRAVTVGFFEHHLKGTPLLGFEPSPTLVITKR